MIRHSVATAWFARSADTKANFVTRSPWRKKPPPCGGSPPPLRAASPCASAADLQQCTPDRTHRSLERIGEHNSQHRHVAGLSALEPWIKTEGYCWRSRWSGGEGGEARGAGGREWALDEPRPEPVEVDGGGCGHALQAHFGQPAVAGAAQAEGAHALRDRALDASTLA